jgi:hypothetical protein
MRRLRTLMVMALAVVVNTGSAHAQKYRIILGALNDTSGRSISKAKVTAANVGTVRHTTVSVADNAQVVIVGATPAGVMTAVAAARAGSSSICLIDESDHIGGIVSGGLTNADIGQVKAVGGLYNEFLGRVRQFYSTKYGDNSEQVKDCLDGRNVEPHVAEQIFREMLAEHPNIQVLNGYVLERVSVRNNRLEAVVVRRVKGRNSHLISGKVFIDATYEGDLAAKAGVPYRLGRESRREYGESLAGRIYTKIGSRDILPGSTGEADKGIQAYCFRLHVTKDPAKRIPFTKPPHYRRNDYKNLLEDIRTGRVTHLADVIQFWRMPNGDFELNSDHIHPDTGAPSESFDLAEENWRWPESSREDRNRIFARYWSYHEGLLWFLQTDPEVPETIRRETASYGFSRDEFVDNNHRPPALYVREGRRIYGEYNFTQREEDPDPATALPHFHADSIAVVSFNWDSHSVHKYDPRHPGAREGYFYASHPPIQVPFGVIVPQKVNGLLVPVACSASHVGYATIRMEPVFMALGQAAGIAAAKAVQGGIEVRNLPVVDIQEKLVRDKVVISYFEDVPPDHPAFAAIQFLGPRGLSRDFSATPDQVLTQPDARDRLARILKASGRPWQHSTVTEEPLSGATLAQWLESTNIRMPEPIRGTVISKRHLTVGDFAIAVAAALSHERSGQAQTNQARISSPASVSFP